jgi:hypothetical protein
MMAAGVGNKTVNGWLYPPLNLGRLGVLSDEFRSRAIGAAGGIICQDAAEAVYIIAFTDSDGLPLDGVNSYTLRFEKGGLPPVHEFWSLTMYGADHNLVDNSISRYAIRDRTPAIKVAADGSITLYLQSSSPGKDKESNVCRRYYPGRSVGTDSLVLSHQRRPSRLHGGLAPALIVSRPAQRSLHVTAYMLAKSPK